jgi:hypothetical protein
MRGANPPRPSLMKAPDLLPLLADQRHDVETPIGVEIDGQRIDRSRQPLQHVLLELPLPFVLQPARLAIVVAEAGGRDIEIAIAIEIGSARIRDTRDAIGDVVRREPLAAIVLEDDDRADAIVVGKQKPQRRDEQVEVAVLVEINGLDMRWSSDAGDGLLGVGPTRGLTDPAHHAAQRVADEDVVQTVTIEIGNGDVGDLRALVALRQIADGTGGEQRGCSGG